MQQILSVVNKITALLDKSIELERVKEHVLVFLSKDNTEKAHLTFNDANLREVELDLGLVHEHEIKFVLERKLSNSSGSKLGGIAYVETDKDIEFFVNQVLEFIRMDEKILNRFTFMYIEN